jgi:hypothetical protein
VTSTDTRQPGDGRDGQDVPGRGRDPIDPPTQVIPVVPPTGHPDGHDDGETQYYSVPDARHGESATTAVRGVDPPTQMLHAEGRPPVPAQASGPRGPSSPRPADTEPVSRLWIWLSPALALLAVALLPVAAATTNLDELGGWGLAQVLGIAGWLALACAVGACVAELWSPRPRVPMLGTATGILILCSTGMPSVVMPEARFTTAWLISGFVDAISNGNGVPPQGVDARFYWPAFFAQWAFFRDAAGVTQLDVVLRWFPPAVVAVWAIGVYALAKSMLGGHRAPWVAAWLFVGLNWIEQDYFSPQATGIVLLLTVLTFALGPLATRRTDPLGASHWPSGTATKLPLWRRWTVAAMTPPNRPTLPPRQLLLIYFCASLCLLAIAPAHQLTPFAIIGQLAVLAVVGRFRGRGLVLVAILAVAVYVLIAGRDFWLTQLSLITGSGEDDGALQSGVADRLAGDTGQIAVKLMRILVPGLTWLLAIVGAWVYWKRRRDLVPIALAAVPMAFAAVQSYGGELFLRIVLYGLPILTILGADALRSFARKNRGREKILAVGMLLTFCSVIVIRGGNDAYMNVTAEDIAITRDVYATTPPGSKIMPISSVGPYGLTGIGKYDRGGNIDGKNCPALAADPIPCINLEYPDVILAYKSMELEGVVLNGKQPGWTLDVIRQAVASGKYTLTYQNGFDAVLRKNAAGPQ